MDNEIPNQIESRNVLALDCQKQHSSRSFHKHSCLYFNNIINSLIKIPITKNGVSHYSN